MSKSSILLTICFSFLFIGCAASTQPVTLSSVESFDNVPILEKKENEIVSLFSNKLGLKKQDENFDKPITYLGYDFFFEEGL